MIEITLEKLFLGYALGFALLLGLGWMYGEWRRSRLERRDQRRNQVCRLCGFGLPVPVRRERITECPQCGAKNERSAG